MVDVLTGKVNPAGRLNETVPVRVEDNPSWGNFPSSEHHSRYGEGIFVGYRGYDLRKLDVVYPLGYGLGYTSFEWSDLAVELSGSAEQGNLAATVRVKVTSTGERAGADVVQGYVRDVESAAARPLRELKGFQKVFLEPGASQLVEVQLDQRAFSFWSETVGDWAVEGGAFVIEAARNARDVVLKQSVQVDAPVISLALWVSSSADEWVRNARAMELLAQRFPGDQGAAPGVFADAALMTVVGNFPMDRLVFFPGSPFSYADLVDVAREVNQA